MTTQSLRGMANHGPMHWRGDRTRRQRSGRRPRSTRTRAFKKFIVAFEGLLGRDSAAHRRATCRRSPTSSSRSRIRRTRSARLDNSLTAAAAGGARLLLRPAADRRRLVRPATAATRLDPAAGFFGTDGDTTLRERDAGLQGPAPAQRVPEGRHVRHAEHRVRQSDVAGNPSPHMGDQVRGFGFLHDGSIDTLFRFLSATVFNRASSTRRLPMGARRPMRRTSSSSCSRSTPTWRRSSASRSRSPATNGGTVGPRIDLLIARAAAVPRSATWS